MDNDQGIWFSSFDGNSWAPQQNVANVATSVGPSLAVFNGRLFMAWKGMDNDQGIWFSSFDGNSWAPQQNVANVATSVGPSLSHGDSGGTGARYSGAAHVIEGTKVFDAGFITTGYAFGGPAKVELHRNGDYRFTGHWHNSGADNYKLDLVLAVITPDGKAFTFRHQGKAYGTFTSGSRDTDWDNRGNNPEIANNWHQIVGARLERHLEVVSGIETAIGDALQFVKDNWREIAAVVISVV